MNEQEKQAYLENYTEAKKKGILFYPDAIFKDAIVALVVFLVLVALAYFVGAPLEAQANPADSNYTPRPEWYFLFLFQLLKYFPGDLEVLGVVVLPTIVLLLLLALPLLDRSRFRYPSARPWVLGATALVVVGVGALSYLSIKESPPPAEAAGGDKVAALYTKNCAPCHGATISVAPDVNLHNVIAEGKHEGMPAWSADLTSDDIDALAGFILSPGGSKLFTVNCSACHQVSDLVAGNPLELKNAVELGKDYPPHAGAEIPDWTETLSKEERTTLLNFLVAPDGQRLFATNCAPCHGRSVAFSGEPEELKNLITSGGMHLDMPGWREKFNDAELDTLANYVVNPSGTPEGKTLFDQYCVSCHGDRIPQSADFAQAREMIASGGGHETMPVWGSILTSEQVDALVEYTLASSQGTSLEVGQEAFADNCAPCHGDLGEGGPNPANPADIIAPISSAEYLKTRDDFTLRSIIAQGQPNFGMSPFGNAFGGPLDDETVDALVTYIRSWEANPPVELPPEVAVETVSLDGGEIYQQICAQCHGEKGEGRIGPALSDPRFQDLNTDQQIFDSISKGHESTAMIGWGGILSVEQIQQLVKFVRQLRTEGGAAPKAPTYAEDIKPLFKEQCIFCHGNKGGWDGSTYNKAMTTGDNAPVIIPGDAENSLLVQKLLGTHKDGELMPPPPMKKLPDNVIQMIVDWINAGAPEK